MPPSQKRHSTHFLAREGDGSVRLRMRFSPEEAALFEEAAGDTPIVAYLHRTLVAAARRQAHAARAKREPVPPPD